MRRKEWLTLEEHNLDRDLEMLCWKNYCFRVGRQIMD